MPHNIKTQEQIESNRWGAGHYPPGHYPPDITPLPLPPDITPLGYYPKYTHTYTYIHACIYTCNIHAYIHIYTLGCPLIMKVKDHHRSPSQLVPFIIKINCAKEF